MKKATGWQKFTAEQTEVLKGIEKTYGHVNAAAAVVKKHELFKPPLAKRRSAKTIKSKLYLIWRARTGGSSNGVVKAEPSNKRIISTTFEGDQLVITYELRLNLATL